MSAKTFGCLLSDEQMRLQLDSGTTLVFEKTAANWQDLERQIERLGFGEKYFVTRTRGARGERTRVVPAGRRFRV